MNTFIHWFWVGTVNVANSSESASKQKHLRWKTIIKPHPPERELSIDKYFSCLTLFHPTPSQKGVLCEYIENEFVPLQGEVVYSWNP